MDEKLQKGNQKERENKQLKIFFVGIGIVVLLIIFTILIINYTKHFEIKGVTFNVVKEIAPYKTSVPVIAYGKKAEYDFYLRKDPRILEKEIPFEGTLFIRKNLVFDNAAGENLSCEGDTTIAAINLLRPFRLLGVNVSAKEDNEKYSPKEDFMFITLKEGNKTEIKKIDEFNYEIIINNCEIFEGTERFMLETLEQINTEWI